MYATTCTVFDMQEYFCDMIYIAKCRDPCYTIVYILLCNLPVHTGINQYV